MDYSELLEDQSECDISDSAFLESLEVTELNQRPLLTCDFSKFDKYFEDSSYTEEEKEELLQTLWNFVVAAISFNVGIHPVQ